MRIFRLTGRSALSKVQLSAVAGSRELPVSSVSNPAHSRVKKTWRRILQKGAGSVVIAAAIVSAPSVKAALLDSGASLSQRVAQAREWMKQSPAAVDSAPAQSDEQAWIRWGNLLHPLWNNWPNWHNWHNWPNWPNWPNY
jgi:hypothetical protein